MGCFWSALRFLTIWPFRIGESEDTLRLGKSSTCFPLVGLLLGSVLVAANWLFLRFFPTQITNAFLVLILAILTRGFHLDGLADTIDAFWGGMDVNDRLSIMQDSAVGSFGTIAIFFALLFKWIFLNSIPGFLMPFTLILMTTLGRWSLTVMSFLSKPAKPEGLGRLFIENTGIKQISMATATTMLISLICLGIPSLLLLLTAGIVAFLFNLISSKRVGGGTGDTLGACAELSEVSCLAVIYLLTMFRG
jgi:adenosylcobinamide-GDP ribazoletransferase